MVEGKDTENKEVQRIAVLIEELKKQGMSPEDALRYVQSQAKGTKEVNLL